ncbi:MAG: DUF4835 domain-containing protein, partial [Paludibacter sp.]
MKHIKTTLFIISLLFFVPIKAQELNCTFKVNSSKIQGTNTSVFKTLEKSVNEFLNNRKWTELIYENEERIQCNINLIINSVDGNSYSGELLVQSRRPVFNSGYYTTLLNFTDKKFSFDYTEYEPLEYNPNNLTSNLVAVMSYYAYLIIGYDMDSFSALGGTPYFQEAENIVTKAQSTSWTGWKAFEDNKNRYALISSIMDEAYKKYRNYFYEYHRLGLDVMPANSANGRTKIADGIEVLLTAYRARPTTILISSFLDAKNDEIINIFKQGTSEEKKKVHKVLSTINPSLNNKYEAIL